MSCGVDSFPDASRGSHDAGVCCDMVLVRMHTCVMLPGCHTQLLKGIPQVTMPAAKERNIDCKDCMNLIQHWRQTETNSTSQKYLEMSDGQRNRGLSSSVVQWWLLYDGEQLKSCQHRLC